LKAKKFSAQAALAVMMGAASNNFFFSILLFTFFPNTIL
jgi:hypothetical protein